MADRMGRGWGVRDTYAFENVQALSNCIILFVCIYCYSNVIVLFVHVCQGQCFQTYPNEKEENNHWKLSHCHTHRHIIYRHDRLWHLRVFASFPFGLFLIRRPNNHAPNCVTLNCSRVWWCMTSPSIQITVDFTKNRCSPFKLTKKETKKMKRQIKSSESRKRKINKIRTFCKQIRDKYFRAIFFFWEKKSCVYFLYFSKCL